MNKKNVIIISSVCSVIAIVFLVTIAVIINKNRSTVNAATLPETTEEIAEAEPEPVPTVEPEPEPTIEPTPETENLEAKNTEEFVIESISETLMYAIATVNVRTSPSVDNARVGKLDIGDAVTFTKKATYTSTNEIWMGYHDSIHNRDLWVNSLYLSSEAPIIIEENTQVNNTTVASEETPVNDETVALQPAVNKITLGGGNISGAEFFKGKNQDFVPGPKTSEEITDQAIANGAIPSSQVHFE